MAMIYINIELINNLDRYVEKYIIIKYKSEIDSSILLLIGSNIKYKLWVRRKKN